VSPLSCALRADKITGGYIVPCANGQTVAHIYPRDSEAEALQGPYEGRGEVDRQHRTAAGAPRRGLARDVNGSSDRHLWWRLSQD
jgi:hypothetical protein